VGGEDEPRESQDFHGHEGLFEFITAVVFTDNIVLTNHYLGVVPADDAVAVAQLAEAKQRLLVPTVAVGSADAGTAVLDLTRAVRLSYPSALSNRFKLLSLLPPER
jgi:hypothetical protein